MRLVAGWSVQRVSAHILFMPLEEISYREKRNCHSLETYRLFFFLILKGGGEWSEIFTPPTPHQWNRPSIKFLFQLGRNLGDILIKNIWFETA